MHIDTGYLVAALRQAPEEQTFFPREVSEYVVEHIFMPLRRDEAICFTDLDFDAFDESDIRNLQSEASPWKSVRCQFILWLS